MQKSCCTSTAGRGGKRKWIMSIGYFSHPQHLHHHHHHNDNDNDNDHLHGWERSGTEMDISMAGAPDAWQEY